MQNDTTMGGSRTSFPPTPWTTIGAARAGKGTAALIAIYWKPCYHYLRCHRSSVEDAKDLTQAFFLELLDSEKLAGVTRSKGLFRTWLKTCVHNFMLSQKTKGKALKRGGGKPLLSLDIREAEVQHTSLAAANPDLVFDLAWAEKVMERALARLEKVQSREIMKIVKRRVCGEHGNLVASAKALGKTRNNFSMAVLRAGRQLSAFVKEELSRTAQGRDAVESEYQYLMTLLKNRACS